MADEDQGQDTGAVGVGGKDTVEELREQWEEEDAAGQPVGEDEISLAVQPPASDIEEDLSSEDDEGVRLYPEETDEFVEAPEDIEERTEFIVMDTRSGDTLAISEFAYNALTTIHAVLPPRMAFYMGVGALIVIEAIEPPVVAAVTLGYEALRRWTK